MSTESKEMRLGMVNMSEAEKMDFLMKAHEKELANRAKREETRKEQLTAAASGTL